VAENNEVVVKPDAAPSAAANAIARLESVLVVANKGQALETEFNAPKRIGLMIAFLVFGVFGLWAALAPIEGAAHATGQVTVKSYKKPIQHREGGIVKEVLVQNGDHVNVGDVLLVLDDLQSLSQLEIFTSQLKSRLAMEARLIAERDNLSAVVFPAELAADDAVAQVEMKAQSQIFQTRKTTQQGEIDVLEQRIEQLESQATGLESVRESKQKLAASYEAELKDFQALLDEGFSEKTQLRAIERNFAVTSGEAAQLIANIAAARIQVGETRLGILQLQNRMQSEVAAQLSDVQTQLKDIRERVIALTDIVGRTEIRSPDEGTVNDLKVHSPGAIVPPGAIIAEIVPQSDELVVDAQVSPMDIDRVALGQEATVRMTAMNSRTVPTLYGTVIELSADTIVDPNGSSYYRARLELKPESLADLQGNKLVPGMPADVNIATGSRTFLQYLMKPLTDSMATSLRED
jgi:membrane fusion protein, epimerase transport system